jgi:hypothetical protein
MWLLKVNEEGMLPEQFRVDHNPSVSRDFCPTILDQNAHICAVDIGIQHEYSSAATQSSFICHI